MTFTPFIYVNNFSELKQKSRFPCWIIPVEETARKQALKKFRLFPFAGITQIRFKGFNLRLYSLCKTTPNINSCQRLIANIIYKKNVKMSRIFAAHEPISCLVVALHLIVE